MGRTLKHILAESLFFRLFIVFVFAWTYLIITYGKEDFFLKINDSHIPILDYMMPYITLLGDGWFALVIALGLFFWKVRYGVIAVVSFLVSAGITQTLKRWVFDWPRPSVHFADLDAYNLVDGVVLHTSHSFPSGHTTSAFSVFCLLSLLLLPKKYLGFLFCFLAILAGFSRCYLFQHFPEDVLVGSIIGSVTSLLVFSWLNNKKFGNSSILGAQKAS